MFRGVGVTRNRVPRNYFYPDFGSTCLAESYTVGRIGIPGLMFPVTNVERAKGFIALPRVVAVCHRLELFNPFCV